jgi:Cu/Ag efflux protein CusF
MKRFVGVLAAAAMLMPIVAKAQSKSMTTTTKVVTATVEAIESSSRTVTLKLSDGTYTQTVAPASMKRFDEVKIGDKVTARYYENIVVRMKQPGEKDVDSATAARTPSGQSHPGGTEAKQRTITATITAIDPKAPSITFSGPNGWKYSSRVADKTVLGTVKVGDKVDIVWTEALLLSLDAPKK